MMKQVELVDGLKVSAMGLGCMGMSGAYGEATDEASPAGIRRALDVGVTLFDTGDFYGNGHNERLLSAALGDDRRGVAVATKTGVVRTPEGMRMRGDRASLHAACEAS